MPPVMPSPSVGPGGRAASDAWPTRFSRRFVLRAGIATGGGLLLGVSLFGGDVADAGDGGRAGVFAPGAFIRIGSDDSVTLIMPAVEMGQGTYTAIPMILAEELDIALGRVKLEAAPPSDELYGNPLFKIQITGGSSTIRAWWMPMRKAGAGARAMLVAAAAVAWGVDPASCRTENGTVFHDATSRSLKYGALANRAARLPPPQNPPLKDPKDFKLVGKPLKRLDAPEKVNGASQYGVDAMPNGVKFATLVSSPVFGGKVAHVDDRRARAVPGVRQIVVLDTLVAVIGDHMWAALQGLEARAIEWENGPHAGVTSAGIWKALRSAADNEGLVVQKVGDADSQLKGAGLVEASYELPFLAHAAMEPMNCTVHVRADACEVWVGTQVMTMAQNIAAKESGLRPDQVTIHNHLLGGGFGRRLEVDGIGKAVRIARHVEWPIKVLWTREEDIQQEMYRPVYHNRMAARLADGKVAAWRHRVAGPAIFARYLPPAFVGGIDGDAVGGAVEQPYDFPNRRIEYVRHEPAAVPTSFWRGVGSNSNVFAVECFMDRLAREARVDPVAFRRPLLGKSPRALAALDLVVEKSGWHNTLPAAAGGARRGRGICVQSAFGSYLAAVAEVLVAADGEVRVTRLVCAVDCGLIVNPDTVVAQIQGGMIFGLTAALYGEITIEGGRVQQSNFNDYRMLRIDETPKIEVHLIPSGDAPGGIGEPGTVVVQPAVANAIYAATGTQLTRMPVKRRLLATSAT
jgi:isoquinoline 1-oxidoreductase beta subunit